MKFSIVLLSLFATIAFSCGHKNGVNNKFSRIYDYEEILTANQEKYLDAVISDYEKKTKKEIMVVTSKDFDDYENAMQYASEFGYIHEVGKYGDQDSGLVIFVSKKLSQTALSTGYGTDRSLKNETCKKIVDSLMIPLFREDKYFDGLKVGLDECIKKWK